MNGKIILFPCGGNAREAVVVIDALRATGQPVQLLGFLDDDPPKAAPGAILGGRSVWESWRGRARLLAVPGSPANYRRRAALIDSFALSAGDSLALVDPLTRVAASAAIGFNTLVMAHGYVGADARIGNHCVLLSHVVVSHDTEVGDYTLIGAHASIAGGVHIGRNCYIGASASIREGVSVGDGALVGMAANVIADVPAGATVVGNPARILRTSA
jgi:sugar O-acyltransferase (sialic acid O-acetyltransferase NeuD family)